ncbi:MAG: arylesterase [Casimicrobiaceae bacterium]
MIAHLLRARAGALALVAVLLLAAAPAFAATAAAAVAGPAAGSLARAPVLLIVGDSISAAYGLRVESGWARLLAQRLQADRYPYAVVNASISGDTTAGGRARFPELLRQHRPAIVMIELGGNDGLRGGDLGAMRANLDAMVAAAKKAGARVLLVGMRMPPNYGPAYTRAFDAVYTDVASKREVPLVPFFFEGFGETSEWFQPDRIHPTAAAQPRLLDNVWPTLKPLLEPRR